MERSILPTISTAIKHNKKTITDGSFTPPYLQIFLILFVVVVVALGNPTHALLSCLRPPNDAPLPPGTRRYYHDL